MESNHTFKTRELTTDDNNFKPFTGELPSHLHAFGERALARYEKTLSPALASIKDALVCVNSAVLRTAYTLDLKHNTSDATDPHAQAAYEAVNDPIFKLKHAA